MRIEETSWQIEVDARFPLQRLIERCFVEDRGVFAFQSLRESRFVQDDGFGNLIESGIPSSACCASVFTREEV